MLCNKNKARYLPKILILLSMQKESCYLNAYLIHYTYRDYTHWKEWVDVLSSRDAWAMCEHDKKVSKFTPALRTIAAVFKKLIFKGGYIPRH